MSHTYSCNYTHIVFSTKNRLESLPSDLHETWAYFVGIGANISLPIEAVGGTRNHMHLLFAVPAKESLSHIMNVLKSNSSKWLGNSFAWQEGYGSFGVSVSLIPTLKRYIQNQAQHHAKQSFEDEFIALLKKHGIQYDPKYVFG